MSVTNLFKNVVLYLFIYLHRALDFNKIACLFSEENESCLAWYLELIYSVLEIDWVRGP